MHTPETCHQTQIAWKTLNQPAHTTTTLNHEAEEHTGQALFPSIKAVYLITTTCFPTPCSSELTHNIDSTHCPKKTLKREKWTKTEMGFPPLSHACLKAACPISYLWWHLPKMQAEHLWFRGNSSLLRNLTPFGNNSFLRIIRRSFQAPLVLPLAALPRKNCSLIFVTAQFSLMMAQW